MNGQPNQREVLSGSNRPDHVFRVLTEGLLYAIHGLVTFVAVGFGAGQAFGQASEATTSNTSQTAVATEAAVAKPTVADRLVADIEQMRLDWQVQGLAVAVVQDDRVILSRGFGIREVGHPDAAVDSETLFAIASNSKAFTAAALAILVDEQRLDWDDHVRDYLPWFKLRDPLATADMRVRDLLCHRSGLKTYGGDLLWWGTKYSPREVLERARLLEPEGAFRSHYGYSNLMYLAAGELIAAVSGQSYTDFVQARILNPVGMQQTVLSTRDVMDHANAATPHKTTGAESTPIAWQNWDAMAAAGGVISNVDDMARWLRLQLRRGALPAAPVGNNENVSQTREWLFSAGQSEEMWTAHTPLPISKSFSKQYPDTHFRAYGLGWQMLDYSGRKLVQHGGGYDGMFSQVVLVPEENIGVVVLTNSMTSVSGAITYTIIDQLLAELDGRDYAAKQPSRSEQMRKSFLAGQSQFQRRIADAVKAKGNSAGPTHALDAYAGHYRCPMYGDATVSVIDGKLRMQLEPNERMLADLSHLHFDTFRITWQNQFAWFADGNAHFVTDRDGQPVRLELYVPNDDFWFDELKFVRVDDPASN